MRKLLLKLANKIYKKYSFNEIKEGKEFTFKGDIYEVQKIVLEQDPKSLDVLKVKLYKGGSLREYINKELGQ